MSYQLLLLLSPDTRVYLRSKPRKLASRSGKALAAFFVARVTRPLTETIVRGSDRGTRPTDDAIPELLLWTSPLFRAWGLVYDP